MTPSVPTVPVVHPAVSLSDAKLGYGNSLLWDGRELDVPPADFRAGRGANAADMTTVLVRDAMAHIDGTARAVLGACSDGDTLRTILVVLRRFSKYEPADSIALRRKIAHRLLDAERYIV